MSAPDYKVLIAARDGEGDVPFAVFETVHRERPRHAARPFRDRVKRAVGADRERLQRAVALQVCKGGMLWQHYGFGGPDRIA